MNEFREQINQELKENEQVRKPQGMPPTGNLRLKKKLILDLILFIILVSLFQYKLFPEIIHEIAGCLIIAGFSLHISLNNKYVKRIFAILKNKAIKKTTRIGAVINFILFADIIVMLISSIMISKELFLFLGIEANYAVWRLIHCIAAGLMLQIVVIHVALHFKTIWTAIKVRHTQNGETYSVLCRVIALVLATLTFRYAVKNEVAAIRQYYSPVENAYINTQYNQTINSQTIGSDNAGSDGNDDKDKPSITTGEDTTKQSLEDYLSKLTCNGCGKHCSLLNPRCGKGETKKNAAISQYNNM